MALAEAVTAEAVDGASSAAMANAAGIGTAPIEVAALADDDIALLAARITDRDGLELSALVYRHAIYIYAFRRSPCFLSVCPFCFI